MKLIVIYGKPAVGKVTIARELARLTGARLFHNHLAVNLARSLFEFGSPGFVELRERVWLESFQSALKAGLPSVIFTFNPESSVSQAFIDGLLGSLSGAGARIVLVEVFAPESVIEERLGLQSRIEDGKLTSASLYRQLRDAGVFDSPVMPRAHLRIDSSLLSAEQAARQIAALG